MGPSHHISRINMKFTRLRHDFIIYGYSNHESMPLEIWRWIIFWTDHSTLTHSHPHRHNFYLAWHVISFFFCAGSGFGSSFSCLRCIVDQHIHLFHLIRFGMPCVNLCVCVCVCVCLCKRIFSDGKCCILDRVHTLCAFPVLFFLVRMKNQII